MIWIYLVGTLVLLNCWRNCLLQFNLGRYVGNKNGPSEQLNAEIRDSQKPLLWVAIPLYFSSLVAVFAANLDHYKKEFTVVWFFTVLMIFGLWALSNRDELRIYKRWIPSTLVLRTILVSDLIGVSIQLLLGHRVCLFMLETRH